MNEGFILLHRKILDWEWYSNINDRLVWFHCLLSANWKDGWFEGKKIERGSFVTSYQKLSLEIGITYQQVRTSLEHLKSTGNITYKHTNKFSIITINNYNKYQLDNTQNNIQLTLNQHSINTQLTLNQHSINNNIIKEINNNESKKEKNNNKYIVEDNNVFKDIIDYLNLRTGQHYKHSTPKTRILINARIKEGFTLEDFKIVIDKMCVEWINTDMKKYLRPETLFGTKFESYLNREVKQTTRNINLSSEEIDKLFN